MRVERLEIEGLLLITPRRFTDARGDFCETYNARTLREQAGIDIPFVQDNQSLSRAPGTLRGLHFQIPPAAQAKLVRVLRGAVFDVAVDLRRGAPTYGRHVALRLDAASGAQLFVPVGFAHGFCTLEPDTEVLYKVSDFYAPQCDKGLAWDDPELAIAWPVSPAEAVLSDKDRR
ncbi:MAG TPA: dTDP-4-dehydrorhamnose 3,5-epimerase, partial [Kiloniellales bacterium]|nr:dTDP-4-dehydrorhamnose 3,5-epimerase [Kiloniellales bacterium]